MDTKGKSGSTREPSVPIAQWWYDLVESLVGRYDKAFQAKDVAEGTGIDQDRISKVRNKTDSPLSVVEAISDFLEIPRPFVSFPTAELAHEYGLKAREAAVGVARSHVKREVGDIEAGVTQRLSQRENTATNRRTHRLQTSEHGRRPKPNRGGARRRGRVD